MIFAVDRAGLVGSDGETHQGIFDLSYLANIPNMNILAPMNRYELADALKFAMEFNGPLAIRYPRGTAWDGQKEMRTPIEYGKSQILYKERGIALLAAGSMVKTAVKVRENLKAAGFCVTLVNVRFVLPLDQDCLDRLSQDHELFVTMEENVLNGGFGMKVTRYTQENELPVHVMNVALPNLYVEHGNVELLKKEVGIDAETIEHRIREYMEERKRG